MVEKISIIVPAIYRPDLTQVCIDSIKNYTKNYELILVQEGDNSGLKRVMQGGDKYIQNVTPKGYSGALNTGLKLATGSHICFMNNDVVAVPGWMDNILKCFEENPNSGLVAPTFWGSGGKQSIDWNREGLMFDYVDNIFSIIGVCFVIPRKVLDDVGIWDESYGHGGEDFDIAYRIQQAGYDIFVARDSFIYHYGGASTREVVEHDYKKAKENQMAKLEIFSKKHNMPMENIIERFNTSTTI